MSYEVKQLAAPGGGAVRMSADEGKDVARRAARVIAESLPDVSEEGLALLKDRARAGLPLSDAARALVGLEEAREQVSAVVDLACYPKELRGYIQKCISGATEAERVEAARLRERRAKKKDETRSAFSPYLHQFDTLGVPQETNRGYLRKHTRGKWWKRLGFVVDVGELLEEEVLREQEQNEDSKNDGEMIEPEQGAARAEWSDELMGIDAAASIVTDGVSAIAAAFGKEFKLDTRGDVSERQMVENLFTRLFAVPCDDGRLHAGRMNETQHALFVTGIYALKRAPLLVAKARRGKWMRGLGLRIKGGWYWLRGRSMQQHTGKARALEHEAPTVANTEAADMPVESMPNVHRDETLNGLGG